MLKRKGFTLLELIVVVAIIAILAGILMPALGTVRRRARIAATEVMISNLRLAISMYDTDEGRLPGYALAHPTLHSRLTATGGGGPYMEFKAEDLQPITGGQEIIDFWRNAYELSLVRPYYEAPAGHRVYTWSRGPDGVDCPWDPGSTRSEGASIPQSTLDNVTSW